MIKRLFCSVFGVVGFRLSPPQEKSIPAEVRSRVVFILVDSYSFSQKGVGYQHNPTLHVDDIFKEISDKFGPFPSSCVKSDIIKELIINANDRDSFLFLVDKVLSVIRDYQRNKRELASKIGENLFDKIMSARPLSITPIDDPEETYKRLNSVFSNSKIDVSISDMGILLSSKSDISEKIFSQASLTISQLDVLGYNASSQEFQKGYLLFDEGNYADAIVWFAKSLESAMISICQARSIRIEDDRPEGGKKKINSLVISRLANICQENGLLGPEDEDYVNCINSLMIKGPARLRNNHGAHSRGAVFVACDKHMAKLMMNLTGAFLVYLVERNIKYKKI